MGLPFDDIQKGINEMEAKKSKKKPQPVPEAEGGFTGGKPWPIKKKEGVK